MKADKKCGNCEWLRSGFCRAMNGSECLYSNNGTVPDYVCRFWSANLDGAACEKCVYWIGKVAGSEFGICHKNAVVLRDYMQTCGDHWCGEFVPAVQK
jgi:hypothetical protein